jgi:hypothetical protein
MARAIPNAFCWTRFGGEAGQSTNEIFLRKERERTSNNGIFLWGIGNSVAPALRSLLDKVTYPEILFSPIKGKPKAEDAEPSCVVGWSSGETLGGERFNLPERLFVTSRFDLASRKSHHYALVCYSMSSLLNSETNERLDASSLRNFQSGNPVGASQVTAVVEHLPSLGDPKAPEYRVSLRAYLVPPYFVRLHDPIMPPDPTAPSTNWLFASPESRTGQFCLVQAKRPSKQLALPKLI